MMSSTSDPYYVARDEVQSSLRKLKDNHTEWKDMLRRENTAKSRVFQGLHTNLMVEVKKIGKDVEDIEDTIRMVEENRKIFPIDDAEVRSRKDFVQASKARLAEIRETFQRAQTKIDADKRELLTREDRERQSRVTNENEAFLHGQKQQQETMIAHQDEQLTELSKCAERLGNTATVINQELADHQRMLQELDEDIDKETEKLGFVMKRVGRLLKTNDRGQLCLIAVLAGLFILLLFLVIQT